MGGTIAKPAQLGPVAGPRPHGRQEQHLHGFPTSMANRGVRPKALYQERPGAHVRHETAWHAGPICLRPRTTGSSHEYKVNGKGRRSFRRADFHGLEEI
jgi:hypothetical protein